MNQRSEHGQPSDLNREAAGQTTARGGQVNPEERHGQTPPEHGEGHATPPGQRPAAAPAPSPQADGDPRPLDAGHVEAEQTPLGPPRR